MNGYIFRSKLWLKLKNESEEKSYFENRLNSMKCWINCLSVIALLTSLLNCYVQRGFVTQNLTNKQFPFPEILFITYVSAGLNTIFTTFILLFRNTKYKQNFYYLQYLSLGLCFFCINFSLSVFKLDPENRRNSVGVESLIKIVNYVVFLEYMDSLVLTFLNLIWAVPVYSYLKNWDMSGFMYPYIFYSFSFICISYFIVYQRKTSFFYSEDNRKKMIWFRDIIENMKSGFIHVKGNKICFLNKVMSEAIQKNPILKKFIREFYENTSRGMAESDIVDTKFFESEENSKRVLMLLLSDINSEILEEDINKSENSGIFNLIYNNYDINNKNSKTDSNDVLNINFPSNKDNLIPFFDEFKKLCERNSGKFSLVGRKTFHIDTDDGDECLSLQVFCRYHLDQETKKDMFEIIFNDVTKAKQIEEKKSEIKYKSLFLSKVAHEFKNPLICIIELVNQLSENFRLLEQGEKEVIIQCEDNLHQINSFSNYMMILIRDFDYFSQKKILNKEISLEKEECDLKEILSFCYEIGMSLLKRNGKQNNILCLLDIQPDVPDKIITDEYRLKQVLVNLISNSIKFTNQGKVVLKVFRDHSDLVFSVSDTGVGIDVQNKNNFFSPYNSCTKSNAVNPFGSGLGMSIIYDLTNALGKQIQFTSELTKGSEFFFSIPAYDKKLTSIKSEEIIFKNNFNLNEITFEKYISNRSASNLIKAQEFHKEEPLITRNCKNKIKSTFSPILRKEKKFMENEDISSSSKKQILNFQELNLDDCIIDITERKSSSEKSTKEKYIFPKIKLKRFLEKSSKEKNRHEIKREQVQENFIKSYQNYLESSIANIDSIKNNRKTEFKSSGLRYRSKNICKNLEKLKVDNILKKETNQIITPIEIEYIPSQYNELTKTNKLSLTSRRKSLNKNDMLSDYLDTFLHLFHLEGEQEYFNILLVDDEKLSRSSNKRLLSDYAKNKNFKINFIEAEDGIECLYILYVCIKKGVKISCVISDQTMTYMNGSATATVLKELTKNENFNSIPFYILTAYEDESTLKKLRSSFINNIFSKPIKKVYVDQIFVDLVY